MALGMSHCRLIQHSPRLLCNSETPLGHLPHIPHLLCLMDPLPIDLLFLGFVLVLDGLLQCLNLECLQLQLGLLLTDLGLQHLLFSRGRTQGPDSLVVSCLVLFRAGLVHRNPILMHALVVV